MARTFTPTDLITLPRLNAAEALALLVSLQSAAQPHARQLPEPVAEALRELQTVRAALQRTRAQRRQVATRSNPRQVREADTSLDRCWRALEQWSSALRMIPASYLDERPRLDALHESLFGEGMGFLNERFEVEWSESETRLDQIKREKLSAVIESLGGGVLLRALRDAHHAYGEVLGITAATPAPALGATVDGEAFRLLFQEAQATIRTYVAEVAVLSHRRDPAHRTLATALLRPLTEWSSRPTASAPDTDDSSDPGEGQDDRPAGG